MMTAVWLLAGSALLYFGAEWLIRGSVHLAFRFDISPLLVGLTVVAFGTSAPELLVSVKAAVTGHGSIAVGNVVGSNIINVAVIMGLSALFRPLRIHRQVARVDAPWLLFFTFVVIALMANGVLVRWESALLLVSLLVYTAVSLKKKGGGNGADCGHTPLQADTKGTVGGDLFLILLGLTGLVLGSHLFVKGAVELAHRLGVSEAVIALTIVALGTSLPELATTVLAAIKKQEDLAVGNIIGSNIFNLLIILGSSGLVAPLSSGDIAWVDWSVMCLTSLLLLVFMQFRTHIGRSEGVLFLSIYLGYLIYRWP